MQKNGCETCKYANFSVPLQANQMKTVKTLHFDFYLCLRISFCFIWLYCVAGRFVTALLCISVVDVIQVLTDNATPRCYWSDLKRKLKAEGSEVYENIVQLKLRK